MPTDSIYLQKSALKMGKEKCYCGEDTCMPCLLEVKYLPSIASAQWRDKGLYTTKEHEAYLAMLDYIKNEKDLTPHASDRALPQEESSCLHSDPPSGERNAERTRAYPAYSR